MMSKKRTLDSFFSPATVKKSRISPPPTIAVSTVRTDDSSPTPEPQTSPNTNTSALPPSNHPSYPCPISQFPLSVREALGFVPAADARAINDQPDLDLLYYAPYIPKGVHRDLFRFLRRELPFYRVCYKIKRGPIETQINTPRFTTVFGLDATSLFAPSAGATGSSAAGDLSNYIIVDSSTKKPVSRDKYKCTPRPMPHCLDTLRQLTEATTGETYNFCLVNYYASGSDSISYHSDDERFLGTNPAIASFSLGAKRDFLMKHKPVAPSTDPTGAVLAASVTEAKPLKLALASGDMILMRGRTQSNWLHSIPKRKGGESDLGRVNITFRKALVKGGTENYYQYNVGDGGVFRWSDERGEMLPAKFQP